VLAWRGPGEEVVDVETVRELASGGGALTGWEVADAVMTRDRERALTAARRLVDAGDEPIKIVGGLAWRARIMLQAKGLIEAGRSPDPALARAWSFRDGIKVGLRRYSLAEVLAFPSELLRADRTLKSRSLNARAVVEDLVDRLTGAPGAGAAGSVKEPR
jgi:DNA polymerase III delta subunit